MGGKAIKNNNGESICGRIDIDDYKKLKEIKSQIRLKISSNIRPNHIRIYDTLPRTSGLKLARNKMRLQYLAKQDKYDDI